MCRWGGRRRMGIERRSPSIIVGTSFCFLWAPLLRHDWLFLSDIFFIFCVCSFSYPSGGMEQIHNVDSTLCVSDQKTRRYKSRQRVSCVAATKNNSTRISVPPSREGNIKKTDKMATDTHHPGNIIHNISNSLVWLKKEFKTFRTYGECCYCCSLGLFGRVDFIADRDGENRESSLLLLLLLGKVRNVGNLAMTWKRNKNKFTITIGENLQ
jgi:hypothetical protein